MTTVDLVYADTPPSLNVIATRGSHWRVTKAKAQWQAIYEGLLLTSRLPRGLVSAEATAILQFPVRRERDEGNYRWLLEKALGDALVNGGWLASDTAERFRFGRLEFNPAPGPARTTVCLSGEEGKS